MLVYSTLASKNDTTNGHDSTRALEVQCLFIIKMWMEKQFMGNKKIIAGTTLSTTFVGIS